MIFNILDNTTELWMTKYIIGEIFSSGGATLYKNHSDQTVLVNANKEQIIFNFVIYFFHEIEIPYISPSLHDRWSWFN